MLRLDTKRHSVVVTMTL